MMMKEESIIMMILLREPKKYPYIKGDSDKNRIFTYFYSQILSILAAILVFLLFWPCFWLHCSIVHLKSQYHPLYLILDNEHIRFH